jgi:hypothetical protein
LLAVAFTSLALLPAKGDGNYLIFFEEALGYSALAIRRVALQR